VLGLTVFIQQLSWLIPEAFYSLHNRTVWSVWTTFKTLLLWECAKTNKQTNKTMDKTM